MHIGKHQLRREQPKKKKQRSGKHDLSHCLNKIWQWGIASSDLLKTFLVNVGDKLDGQQAISLKQESIPLFPNMPGGQQNKSRSPCARPCGLASGYESTNLPEVVLVERHNILETDLTKEKLFKNRTTSQHHNYYQGKDIATSLVPL
jgi:hypothetical protein